MHEVSIAQSILDIVEDVMKEEKASRVLELTVDVGRLSGVVYDSLSFAMEIVKRDTVLETADIILNDIAGKAECLDCGRHFEDDQLLPRCPDCEDFNVKIIEGRELKVRSLKVE